MYLLADTTRYLIWSKIEWDLLRQNKCRLRIMQLTLDAREALSNNFANNQVKFS